MKSNYYQPVPEWVGPVLNPNEKIIWVGEPMFSSFMLSGVYVLLREILGSALMIYLVFHFNRDDFAFLSYGLMIAVIASIALYVIVRKIMEYRNAHYCITDSRIVLLNGFLYTTYKFIEIDQINFTDVKVDFFHKKFDTGTLLFYSGELEEKKDKTEKFYDKFESVKTPFEVLNYITQAKSLRKSAA